MPNHEFENYLVLVGRLLRLSRSQKEMIRDELRDHLESRISELVESGVKANDAMRQALEEFGDAALLAQKFQSVFHVNQRRWMMRFATFSIAGTFVVAVLIMAMWPTQARFGTPSTGIAQDERTESSEVSIPLASSNTIATRKTDARIKIASSEDVNRIMQQPCSFDYHENEFNDIRNELQERYNINVLLDSSAKDDSLTEDSLITFQIRNSRLSTALRLMLAEHNATYMIHDGILRIISRDVAAYPEFFSRRIFDCRDLLSKIANTDDRVGTPLRIEYLGNNEQRRGRKGGGVFCILTSEPDAGDVQAGSGGGLFGGGATAGQLQNELIRGSMVPRMVNLQEKTDNDQTTDVTALLNKPKQELEKHPAHRPVVVHEVTPESILSNVIRASIGADGWDDTDGDGTLIIVSGFMVVTQSQQTLDEISIFIDELKQRMK